MSVVVVLALVSASHPRVAVADQLTPETLKAWDNYVSGSRTRIEARIAARQQPFLWMDEDHDRARRVLQGEIVVVPAQKNNPRKVPHGLIHDWVGAVFVPHATLDQVLRVLNSYDHYPQYYKPMIARSRLLNDNGTEQTFGLVLVQKEFGVTAAIDVDMDSHIVRVDEVHAYKYSFTTRVQAIEHIGKPDEFEDPVDSGPGYVWRLVNLWRLEQRDSGVCVEMEAIAMSRTIPFAFRWLIQPLTERVPRELATAFLRSTRDAVTHNTISASNTLSTRASHDERVVPAQGLLGQTCQMAARGSTDGHRCLARRRRGPWASSMERLHS